MKLFFSAGEPSGDQHSARLIRELQALNPAIVTEGFGGPEMQQAGCQLQFELTELAVMGFLRVVPLLAKFRRLVKQAEVHFDRNPPDAVVLVDFPGFNWWIARAAKQRGIPVYYFLPPQLWAWAGWRIKRVRKWVDHVLCALPFEHDWYSRRGVKTTWVGHPFFDQVADRTLNQDLIAAIRSGELVGEGSANIPGNVQPAQRSEISNLKSEIQRDEPSLNSSHPAEMRGPVVALLPGSRRHEIEKNWPLMLEVVRRVSSTLPGAKWVVGSYREQHRICCEELQAASGGKLPLHYFVNQTSEVIEAADCCLMVSGSISLELLARRKPGIVLYRVGRVSRFFARFLMKCRFMTLTNLIADEEVMPEFICEGDPESDLQGMTAILTEWLSKPQSLAARREQLERLAGHATTPGACQRSASILIRELSARAESNNAARRAA